MNPDDYNEIIATKGLDGLPRFHFENDDFTLMVSAIPKSKAGRGNPDLRPIGVYPSMPLLGGPEESIKNALMQKAVKYGQLDKPYIICLNSFSDKGTDTEDVYSALFGTPEIALYTNRQDPNDYFERFERGRNGFFYGPGGARFTRISALLITQVHLGNLCDCLHWFVPHPFSKRPIDPKQFALSYTAVESATIVQHRGIVFVRFFHLLYERQNYLLHLHSTPLPVYRISSQLLIWKIRCYL